MALNTGMRLGELTALEWKDIDFKRAIIRVDDKEGHHTKNYEPRTIPMNQQLLAVLRKIASQIGFTFRFPKEERWEVCEDAYLVHERGQTHRDSPCQIP